MRRLREYGSYAIGFASLFLLWHVAAVYLVQSALFPPPGSVIARAVALFRDGTLVANVAISLQRILTGFVCGSLLGIPIGLAMGSFPPIRRILDPYTEFLRFIPAVAMITVAVIWFGIGETSKLFLIIYATVFVVVLNTAAAWPASCATRSGPPRRSAPRAFRSSVTSRSPRRCPIS